MTDAMTSRRQFLQAGAVFAGGSSLLAQSLSKPARRLADCGWVWEGNGIDKEVHPSIFGAGEGAEYFGLSRAIFLFHPSNDLAMQKRQMRNLKEIVCDISKWKARTTEQCNSQPYVDADPKTIRLEAENVSQLSTTYRNITGAFHDDMWHFVKKGKFGPSDYRVIRSSLASKNSALRLWVVVYTNELDEDWTPFSPFMDVVNLWVWGAENIVHLDSYMTRCREVFPGKPINLGCYLRDYPTKSPLPMDMLRFQWERVLKFVQSGAIAGYSILGTWLIDTHQDQARWVRDFIAAN